jgi:hypothetical protein
MFGFSHSEGKFNLFTSFYDAPLWLAGIILLFVPNSNEIAERFRPNLRFAAMLIAMVLLNLTFLNSVARQDFLYFDF